MPLYGQGGYGQGRYGLSDTGPLFKQPIQYYLNLLASQYKLSPKFNPWLAKALQPLDDLTNCLAFLNQEYDVGVAFGQQLDWIGVLVGQSRTVAFQPSNNVSPTLTDAVYRILLQATIARNQWNGLLVSLPSIWAGLFPSGRLIVNDNQNMSCTILLSGSFSSIIQDLIVNGYIVPRPEGVLYTYSFAELPVFGADLNNSFVAGADIGHAS